MKLLFVHDGTLKYNSDKNYFGSAVNSNTLKRYDYLSDQVTIAIRTVPFSGNDNHSKYSLIPDKYTIRHIPNYMSLKGILFARKQVRKQIRQLVSENDLIIARFSGETGKIAAKECQKQKKACIIECVGCYWDSLWNYGLRGKIFAPLSYITARKLIKKAPYVIYVTNEFLQKRYPADGKWIPASNVELKEMSREVLSSRLEKSKNFRTDRPIIVGTAAAIDVPFKGQAYVIDAISKLKKQGLEFEYQIIGTGSPERLRAIAEKKGVSESVNFLGVLPHDQVFDWIDGLDLYIQPSDQEGLPRALIEAMSRGCPAIGSSTAGIPELLDPRMIFERKKPDQLAKVMEKITSELLTEQSSKNYETALNYQRDVIYKRRNQFFDMVREEKKL